MPFARTASAIDLALGVGWTKLRSTRLPLVFRGGSSFAPP